MPAATKKKNDKAKSPSHPKDPSYTPPRYDPVAGKKALHAFTPALGAMDAIELVTAKADVEAATLAALNVVGFVSSPDVRPRFARLPAQEFDIAHLDDLGPLCFATLYALAEARAAGVLESEAKLPAALVAEGAEVEARMQAVCEYQLADDPEIGPELERLRSGSGHRDLANDLLGYARIYELCADVVKRDRKHYRPGDAALARDLAGEIFQRLSAAFTPRARAAYDRYVRVWTLLNKRYDEVRTTALWLFRHDPRAADRFPSLFAVGRPSVGRRKKADPEPAQDGGGAQDGGVAEPGGVAQPPADSPA